MKSFRITTSKDKEAAKAYIDRLPEGKTYDCIVKQYSPRRTIPQNNLFHLWVACIDDETGAGKDDIKRYCKECFIGYREKVVFGKTTSFLPSTSELSTVQMSEFMNRVEAWAATELGIVLPHPEDQFFEQFNQHYKDKL